MTTRDVTVVVGAALLDDGRLLAARRTAPPELAGRWELPGGKTERGETTRDALVRELREELGIEAEPLERVPGEWPLKPGYVLHVWTARILAGSPGRCRTTTSCAGSPPTASTRSTGWTRTGRPWPGRRRGRPGTDAPLARRRADGRSPVRARARDRLAIRGPEYRVWAD